MVKGLEGTTEGVAEVIWFVQLRREGCRFSVDLIVIYSFFLRESRGTGAHLFCLITSDRIQWKSVKLCQWKY